MRIFHLIIASIIMSGCMSITTTPTPIRIENAIPTTESPTFAIPTPAPTASLTPRPVPSATADPRAGVGDDILRDSFDRNQGWELSEEDIGATSILGGRLIITLRESRAFRYTLAPTQPLTDFYMELEVRPDLCHPDDEFGLIYRLNAAFEHYRFAMNCSGQSRVSRILQDGSRALVPYTDSASIIPGPMAVNRLAMRAMGDQFSFWINDVEVFTLKDEAIQRGLVGAYVRTGRQDLATITFDNLVIQDLVP